MTILIGILIYIVGGFLSYSLARWLEFDLEFDGDQNIILFTIFWPMTLLVFIIMLLFCCLIEGYDILYNKLFY